MTKIVHINKKFDGSAEAAFQFFVRGKYALDAIIEPKVGGKYELFWDLNDRTKDTTAGCKFTIFQKNKMIGADWTGPLEFDDIMNKTDPFTHLLVTFSQTNDDKVEINLIHTGWGSNPEWERARLYFENAWIQVLKMLKNYLKKGN
jgi:hypothetical protein